VGHSHCQDTHQAASQQALDTTRLATLHKKAAHETPQKKIALFAPWACMNRTSQTGMDTSGCKFTCLTVYEYSHRYMNNQESKNEDIKRPLMECYRSHHKMSKP
jgi:hypothetical protein